MRLVTTAFLVLPFVAADILGTSAWAQSTPQTPSMPRSSSTASDDENASELFRLGKAFFAEGKLKEAYKAYKTAWSLKKRYDIAGNLGNVAFELGKMREAAEYLSYCKRNFPATGLPEQKAKLETLLDKARKQVGTLSITICAPNCQVFVDSERILVGELPMEVFIEPGSHTIEVKRAGFKSTRKTIQVNPGSTQSLDLEVPSIPENTAPPPVKPIPSAPPATVVSNGPSHDSSEIAPDRRTPIMIAGISIAGVGVIAGVATAAVSSSKAGEANEQHIEIERAGGSLACVSSAFKAQCENLHSLRDSQATLANISVWSFIGAGTIGAGTAVYYALSGQGRVQQALPKADKKAPSVGLILMPHGGGFVVSSAW